MADYGLCYHSQSFQPAECIFNGYTQGLVMSLLVLAGDGLAATAKAFVHSWILSSLR